MNNVKFSSAEQAMMYHKAKLMKDDVTADYVLACHDPKRIKELGRMVSNFDQIIWNANKLLIMEQILLSKFGQNPELQQRLLATNNAHLVEAAHYDTIWGNGLSVNHPDAKNPKQWPGQNLLGKTLMYVRHMLREGKE